MIDATVASPQYKIADGEGNSYIVGQDEMKLEKRKMKSSSVSLTVLEYGSSEEVNELGLDEEKICGRVAAERMISSAHKSELQSMTSLNDSLN